MYPMEWGWRSGNRIPMFIGPNVKDSDPKTCFCMAWFNYSFLCSDVLINKTLQGQIWKQKALVNVMTSAGTGDLYFN